MLNSCKILLLPDPKATSTVRNSGASQDVKFNEAAGNFFYINQQPFFTLIIKA